MENNMSNKLIAVCFGGIFALTSFLAQPVLADEWNKRTEFQFSAPVAIPGMVLLPGKYIFQIADLDSERNIVQVFSENSKGKDSLLETLIASPDSAPVIPDKPTVTFEEGPAGTPEAIRSWFYPGDDTGWAFNYGSGKHR
jgi:hypothetical protein